MWQKVHPITVFKIFKKRGSNSTGLSITQWHTFEINFRISTSPAGEHNSINLLTFIFKNLYYVPFFWYFIGNTHFYLKIHIFIFISKYTFFVFGKYTFLPQITHFLPGQYTLLENVQILSGEYANGKSSDLRGHYF